ncbi:MAG: hypothetical protein ABIF87_09365 [Pseudomonadota bacterium]
MDNTRIQELIRNLDSMATDDLLRIWNENNRQDYTNEAFEAIRQLLVARNVNVQAQLKDSGECAQENGLHDEERDACNKSPANHHMCNIVSFVLAAICIIEGAGWDKVRSALTGTLPFADEIMLSLIFFAVWTGINCVLHLVMRPSGKPNKD